MAAFGYNGFDGLASFGHNGCPSATMAGCEAAASINGLWFSAASINGLWINGLWIVAHPVASSLTGQLWTMTAWLGLASNCTVVPQRYFFSTY
jgi:hypothetical protein